MMPDRKDLHATGFTSEVFKRGTDRILKLRHASFPASASEHEFLVSRAIHAAGIPVPESLELIELDGRGGIIFEFIEGTSLFRELRAKPWTLFKGAREVAELHAKVHSVQAPPAVPSQRDLLLRRIESATHLTTATRENALEQLESLPDGNTLCHGDFHPENIIRSKRGPVIIDWATASRGNPHGDVATTVQLVLTAPVPPGTPRTMKLLIEISRRAIARTYLNRYLELTNGTRDQAERWLKLIAFFAQTRKPLVLQEIVS